jgi:molybdopterin-guanine dinucleotide biosynthesis protein A
MDKRIGVLLVGGVSRRFGSPKALAVYQGRTFLEISIENLKEVCDEIRVSVSSQTPNEVLNEIRKYDVDVIFDNESLSCKGPLRGLISSLASEDEYEYAIVLGVDYPFLKSSTLKRFVSLAKALGYNASTVLPWREFPSITIGFIKAPAMKRAQRACNVKKEMARLTDLYRCSPDLLLVGWRILTDDPKEFVSVNTPEQLKIKELNLGEIRDVIEIKEKEECFEALRNIERGLLEEAVKLFELELKRYERFGIKLFKEHIEKDLKYYSQYINKDMQFKRKEKDNK